MVATRSQDHTLDDVDVQGLVEKTPLSIRSKKRKVEDEEYTVLIESKLKRRRRTSSRAGDLGVNENSGSPKGAPVEDSNLPENGIPIRKSKQSKASPYRPNHHGDEEVMVSVTVVPRIETHPQAVNSSASWETASDSPALRGEQRKKKPAKHIGDGAGEATSISGNKPEENAFITVDTQASPANVVQATHKRFGSEDLDLPEALPMLEQREEPANEVISDRENDDDDDAPETVTASAGFVQARTAMLEATKVAAR